MEGTVAMVNENPSWLMASKKRIICDITTTENGSSSIERNENCEISLHQDVEGGLKERWNQMMYIM